MGRLITDIPFWSVFLDCVGDAGIERYKMQDISLITDEEWLAIARWWRNVLLNESDWSQVVDNALTASKKEEWRIYRESLRNITDLYPDPKTIIFPDLPDK